MINFWSEITHGRVETGPVVNNYIAVNDGEAKIQEQNKEGDESCGVYPQIVGLDCKLFQLSDTPFSTNTHHF